MRQAAIRQEEHTDETRPSDKGDVLRAAFGFSAFRDGQEPVIDALLAGENVLAVMPTGAGKSLCFQLPALMLPGLAIIISPLIALMENQVMALQAAGIAAGRIHSGRPREDNIADWKAATAGELKLLYMSPERLLTPRMMAALERLPLSLFVIDEAHCISQWGHDFRKDYIGLACLREKFPGVPLAGFTATADDGTRQDIITRIFHGKARLFVQGFDRPNIAITVEEKRGAEARVAALVAARDGDQGIIYCLSRKGTEKMAETLRAEGHNAIAYHAGLADEERTERLNRFLTEPDLVVCATIAFGMGIDKPDIRYVIHMNLPASPEAYYQEIGRAGRDGEPAEAILLYGNNDLRLRRTMIDESGAAEPAKRAGRRRLDALAAYAEAVECRRNVLLAYFGEEKYDDCGQCDICRTPPKLADGTELAKCAFDAITATGSIFGQAHIVSVLRGKENDKTRAAGHDRLPVWGTGAALSDKQWRRLICQMLAAGLIEAGGEFGSLSITEKGSALAAGEGAFRYRQDRVEATSSKRGPTPLASGQVNAKLLSALKQKRLELARAKGVPAYVVFSDRTLIDMASKKPANLAAFHDLYGVGESKARDYAAPFLDVIAGF